MAWNKSTIVSNNPDSAIADQFAALCGGSGVANWSFVENVPAGTGAGQSGSASYSVDVFKCSGSGTDANSAGVDWYIGIARYVASNTILYVWAFLLYSPIASASNKGMCAAPIGYPGSYSTTPPDPTTYRFDYTGGNPNYRTFATRSSASRTNGNRYYLEFLNTTGFVSGIKLTKDCFTMSFAIGSSNYGVLVGLLDSLVQTISDPTPLVMMNMGRAGSLGGVSSGNGCFATLPGVSAAEMKSAGYSYNWQAKETIFADSPLFPGGNVLNSHDKWYGEKIGASRELIQHYASDNSPSGTWPHLVGFNRGLVKADWLQIKSGGTINLFDTCTIDGNADWTVVQTDTSRTTLCRAT